MNNAQQCLTLFNTTHQCTTLFNTTPHCLTLHISGLHYSTLHSSVLHCPILQSSVLHCSTLQSTLLHCLTLRDSTLHATAHNIIPLHFTALHRGTHPCTTPQCTTLHCTTLNNIVYIVYIIESLTKLCCILPKFILYNKEPNQSLLQYSAPYYNTPDIRSTVRLMFRRSISGHLFQIQENQLTSSAIAKSLFEKTMGNQFSTFLNTD